MGSPHGRPPEGGAALRVEEGRTYDLHPMSAVLPNSNPTGRAPGLPIAVVGLGHVGLPLAELFCRGGHRVLGFDREPGRLEQLRGGRMPLTHLRDRGVPEGLEPTADLERLQECGTIVLCLPTPLDAQTRKPDLTALRQWRDRLADLPSGGGRRLLLVTSTVPPGTTRALFAGPLAERFDVAISPEREDPGVRRPAESVPRVVGAAQPRAMDRAAVLLESIGFPVHRAPSLEVAEASKLWENLYRSVNIALAAELERLLEAEGIDPNAVLAAASTKPFGFAPFYAGAGAGGPCIPEVARFLDGLGSCALLEEVDRVHAGAAQRLIERLDPALAERSIAPESARVLVIGVAYKPGVADIRNAPGARLLEQLAGRGNPVAYLDPLVRSLEVGEGERLEGLGGPPDELALAKFDAVVLIGPPPESLKRSLVAAPLVVVDPRGWLGHGSGAEALVPGSGVDPELAGREHAEPSELAGQRQRARVGSGAAGSQG